ncbi:FAS1-like dehydratase domain-containing protein [Actinomadura physcomitrii]|uniref:FAS1-like dehydratase domain-containing protein n=1 Tax=Actinomadura physcomitrii TaxID=2650748 RepID=UPI00136A2EBC|nr:MaoC family dehydratase N-terminal domain-containing protein [Actinomadura physcomitrii]
MPVPPTFFFSASLESDDPFRYLLDAGIDLRHVLHGEQHFAYSAMAYAGDTLTVAERIVDVTSKRGGAMELLTKETAFSREGERIAVATTVIVVRDPEVTA